MSLVKIQGNASGTGAFTIAAPNSNTDRTLTLPDATGTINTSGAVNEVPAGSVSAPSIYPTGDTNTGIYFSTADTVDVSTGGTQRGQFDSSGNFKFNSGYGSVATAYGCRAWVNFNGTGTVAIRASGNVTSITDNGTGDYTVNFTISMPDVNFSIAGYTVNPASRALVFGDVNTYATGSIRVNTGYITGFNGEATSIDATYVNIAVFR